MTTRVFVAGATGVIGRSLIPLLRAAGHSITGATRTTEGESKLEAQGVNPVVLDVFDCDALERAVVAAAPDVVIHQLTDLAAGIDSQSPEQGLKRNARLRREGTANLANAARAAGAKRLIAQSIAWAYAPKDAPFLETDPLDIHARGARAISVCEGVVPLESAVLDQSEFVGIVLRYGQLYGPRTWSAEPTGSAPVHVEAAAYAAFLAIDHGGSGAYNIADPGGAVAIEKAVADLGWRHDFRIKERG
ncbi:NAD-dependent epimerase/dehydratase family protein [Bradyrhizobium sp. LHD-71]|uniref:NAD-dependent epimerase/dehydratase family protein n=1 Tax=Bradyrhizobium sp. LHD-71 TaxID=3072141 RepID=UPI00280F2CF0|nr:NAD-dependent epimerase/dehydratase family protein [Bradyrhizobium sp. LHD-71]MDQ8730643.1 NAD-dependent epimerase/dehydratase family protein [Bradyrhizobium sp. LHD-71]